MEKALIKVKEKYLIISPYFHPFYKFGGAVVTISNLYFAMRDIIDITVLSKSWAPEVESNKNIKYLDTSIDLLAFIKKNHYKYESVYLNSFFSPSWSILPYIFLKVIGFKGSIIFFPRGELKKNALIYKKIRKFLYLICFKNILNSRSNIFIVSDELEAEDLKRIFPNNALVTIPDFLPSYYKQTDKRTKPNTLNLVFISHLRRSKNLMFVLKLLKNLPEDYCLTIYGNADDPNYFQECIKFINQNRLNSRVYFKGLIRHGEVIDVFNNHNFFIFPTETENFGYVILESMLGGCIPIISRYTPWSEMKGFPGLSLDLNIDIWTKCVTELADDHKKIQEMKQSCEIYANNFLRKNASKEKFLAHIYDR